MSRRNRRISKSRIRNLIIVAIIAICLFVIYKFNFSTKSEVTKQTPISFVEYGTENSKQMNLEVYEDENGNSYIVLPETVNGFFVQKYYIIIENSEQTSIENVSSIEANNQENIEEINDITSNTDTTINDTEIDINSQNIDNDEGTSENSTEVFETSNQTNSNEQIAMASEMMDSTTSESSDNVNDSNNSNSDENNDLNTENEIDSNTDVEDGVIENSDIQSNDENSTKSEETVENNTAQSENIPQTTSEANSVDEVIENTTNILTENNESLTTQETEENVKEYLTGERYYLDKEDIQNETVSIQVEYQTIEINNIKLYNQELKADLDNGQVKVIGYIPDGYYLNVNSKDNNEIKLLMEDVEEFINSDVLLAYDITITNGTEDFQPKDYYQTTTVSITSSTALEGNLNGTSIGIVHIKEDEEEIKFEKINVQNKTNDTVEFVTDEFSDYAIMAYAAVQPDSITVYDYDSDYNYYYGKNYTDEMAGTNQEIYTDDTLAKVTINYYGYDYDFVQGSLDLSLNKSSWQTTTATRETNTRYSSTVTVTVAGNENDVIDTSKEWQMSFIVPTGLLADETENRNSDKISDFEYNSNTRIVTIKNNSFENWTQNSLTSYTLTFTLVFSTNTTATDPSTFSFYATKGNLVGHISADESERQTLFSYVKCIPITNGNISIDLIDNPYMDRPAGYGFDGWTTNEDEYNITINGDTKVQTLTTSLNGTKEIVIDLYANWKTAKIVFVDSSNGNDNNDGSINNPVKTWTGVKNRFTNNIVTAENASNRELNIVVLKNGTLTSLSNIGCAYTLTSLYDGNDYRTTNTYLYVNSNFTLSYDLQLDFINTYGSNNYTSETVTSTINYYLIGNAKNLRIGRGMMPLTVNNTTTTFAQIQGGPTANNINNSYKLVIESGRYANIQTGRAAEYTYTSSATMVLGCDFDRINQNNDNLMVYNRTATRSGAGTITSKDTGKPVFEIIVKSGTLGMDFFNRGTGDFAFAGIYLGGHSSGTDNNDRVMIVEGGEIANLLGGLAIQDDSSTVKTYIYVKGGNIQNIVGGAGVSTTRGDRIIQVTDGTVAYSVSGGSNGYTAGQSTSANPTGQLVGNTLVYIGGNAVIGTEDNTVQLYDVNAGCVLGAGNGNDTLLDTAGKVTSSHVIIDGNAKISNCVYGGGNYGTVGPKSNDNAPDRASFTNSSSNITSGEKYLIANGTASGSSDLSLNGTTLTTSTISTKAIPSELEQWIVTSSGNGYTIQNASTGRYLSVQNNGWNYSLTTSTTASTFTISTSGTGIRLYSSTARQYLTLNNGTWSLNNNNATTLYLLKYTEIPLPDGYVEEPTILIDILGGNVLNDVYGGANRNGISGNININMHGGTVSGTIYGGSNSSGTVSGSSIIMVDGGIIGTSGTSENVVYGGGKGAGTVISTGTTIDISDKVSNVSLYGSIYGGSALGTVNGNTIVNVKDILSDTNNILINGNIYGGGMGDTDNSATSGGDVTVNVDGGTYSSTKVFGGCNINGNITGNILVNIGENYKTIVNEVYGGGNQASITSDTDSVYVYLYKNATADNAFNGGNSAGVEGDNTTTPRAIYANGATVGNVYGGSNSSGDLTETFVYCQEGATIGNVFGGGYGSETNITGDTYVDIKDSTIKVSEIADENGNINGCVYGGGNAGIVAGNTNVIISTTKVENSVYGGGKAASVGTTNVSITDSDITNNVYGGGEEGQVVTESDSSISNVLVENSNTGNVFGGGKGTDATVNGSTSLIIDNSNIIATETTDENGITVYINGCVYGGGDAGLVTGDTLINIFNLTNIAQTVYGGGNNADVDGNTSVSIEESNANNVYGGGNAGSVNGSGRVGTDNIISSTAVSIFGSTITDTVYGGGNKGEVTGNTNVVISNLTKEDSTVLNSSVTNSVFGGGKASNVNGTTVSILNRTETGNVFGGGDQGEVVTSTNVIIDNSVVKATTTEDENTILTNGYVFGGGNGASSFTGDNSPGQIGENTSVIIRNSSEIQNQVFGAGKGITAFVLGNTEVSIKENSQIASDVYGGGDNGAVNGSTSVAISSSTIGENAYAAGNGSSAVVQGNSYIYAEGTTKVGDCIYGGGNAAETGIHNSTTSIAIVDIAGATVNGNVYGGANSSQINGDTVINIGNQAINDYYNEDKAYEQGIINIAGTVYGGGHSMNVNTEEWDDDAISVTSSILINIDGEGYDENSDNTINIYGSIFGSGNASNATQDGDVNIKNYGTDDNRKKGLSIQRCTTVVIDNSVLWLTGVKDSTSNYKETPFSFNKVAALKIKNNTILYLKSGANRLSSFYSLDENDNLAEVNIDKENNTVEVTSDNRIYMANSVNLNISPSDPKYEWGPVKGMTFFGIYKSASEDDDDSIYMGIYDKDYTVGESITSWNSRDFIRTYVVGSHVRDPEQDITKDGFYTNFEALDEGYEYDNISETNYSATSYTDYITPTPKGNYEYYYWYAGPDQDTYIYDVELIASKFSSLGAVILPFTDMNFPDATLTMSGVDSSGLNENVQLVNKNEIENINDSDDDANSVFGLSMKTGNTGWSMSGDTNFYNSTYDGTSKYQFENAESTPSLSFYLHHSNNITKDESLGTYLITMNLTYWKDELNRGTALVIIRVAMYTKNYTGIGYNAAITPGMQYDLFTTNLTNITTDSSFSVYFEMGEKDFFDSLDEVISNTGLQLPENYYENSYRVISTGKYVFPENTTITMIDRYDKNNPKQYYYIVTADDEASGRTEFKLTDFLVMDSTDEKYNEAEMREKYYLESKQYEYENFIFIVNFEGAEFEGYEEGEKITPSENYFKMELRVDVVDNDEQTTVKLAEIINDQKQLTEYGIFNAYSTIALDASLSKTKLYIGKTVSLDVKTIYNANINTTVYDTRYFDKKLGVKLTFYKKNDSGEYEVVNGASLLGTYFELNGERYYPRADGTTRIKLTELVSNSSSSISIVTSNSSLSTGSYYILVESFGSADGIYYGIEASDQAIVYLDIINDIYGLNSTLPEEQVIIDKDTGYTLDKDTGEISKNKDNSLNFNLEYLSGLNNPYITISLYRRDYDETITNPYENTYTLVDLADYVNEELIIPTEINQEYNEEDAEFIESIKKFDKEYIAVDTQKINETVINDMATTNFELNYTLKSKLKTGTYKVVFTLYDANSSTAKKQTTDADGNITEESFNITDYEYIGETFSYIIIK